MRILARAQTMKRRTPSSAGVLQEARLLQGTSVLQEAGFWDRATRTRASGAPRGDAP